MSEKKPLDMTTDEAMDFLFPKEVVKELKQIANQPKRHAKANQNKGNNGNSDSSYLNNNE